MEQPKVLTKKQRKEFLRLWIGANLFHLDFGFDETNISDIDAEILHKEKIITADKFLKENNAYSSTKAIFEFVVKNY